MNTQPLHEFVDIILVAIATLLPIVNPLGGAPIYLAMITGLPDADRPRMAYRVAINSFILLLASILIGAYVLDFFGVSIPAVQVAGGIVVCSFAWSLLNGQGTPAVSGRTGADGADMLKQRAFYPLTMPLTVGPGSMSVAMTLGANPPGNLRGLLETSVAHAIGVLITALAIYLSYRYAQPILRRLGNTGTNVFMRLSAFILLAIGTQIVWNGVRGLFATLRVP